MPMTFGEAMQKLIKDKGLSATAVAEDLKFKSRTAFFRILHDESRMPSIQKCFEAAKASTMLALTDQEIRQLYTSMYVNELGKKNYTLYRIFRRISHPKPETQEPLHMTVEGMSGVETVEELLCRFAKEGEMHVVILGRCDKRILDRLHRLTWEANVTRIVHLFAIDRDNPQEMEVFADISTIMFSSAYIARYIDDTGKGLKNWWMRSGAMLIFPAMGKEGRTVTQLTWMSRERYFAHQDASGSLEAFWEKMILNMWDKCMLLKKEQDAVGASPDIGHYAGFTDDYRKIELNRAIYMVKPDFPINCVPVEWIMPVIVDKANAMGVVKEPDFDAQFARLYEIHKSRVENIYTKKKVTHMVLDIGAMMDFARTGQRKDHFFLGRAYTPDERVKLLTLLRDQTRDNPSFNIWFSEREDIVRDKEVTVYDGYGVALVKADTSWQLEKDHQEIMIENRDIVKYVKDYFVHSLLAHEVRPQEESIRLLEEMIAVARQAKA